MLASASLSTAKTAPQHDMKSFCPSTRHTRRDVLAMTIASEAWLGVATRSRVEGSPTLAEFTQRVSYSGAQ